MQVERKAKLGSLTFEVRSHHDQRDGDWKTLHIGHEPIRTDREQEWEEPTSAIQQREWEELKKFVDEEFAR